MGKIWNIVILSLLLATLGSASMSILLGSILPIDYATPLAFLFAVTLGFKSRAIVEKVLGYSIQSCIEEYTKNHKE